MTSFIRWTGIRVLPRLKAPAWGFLYLKALWKGTEAKSGPRAEIGKEVNSSSPCRLDKIKKQVPNTKSNKPKILFDFRFSISDFRYSILIFMDKKPKILLVDDEPDVLSMTKMRLASAGYEVITAEEGVMAYNMAKSEAPDLIILDVMLPGMDGYHICRLLKFDQKYRSIPIIMLTARGQKKTRN